MSLAPAFVRPGPPILLGWSERAMLAACAAWLAAAGIGAVKAGRTGTHDPRRGA